MFDWEDFLELAEQLSSASNEASQRTAISRAYYAAYHAASSYIRRTQLIAPGRQLAHYRRSRGHDVTLIAVDHPPCHANQL